jgi:hypothetical protein
MSRFPRIVASIVLGALAVAAGAWAAEEPTREGYVAQVEPICEATRIAEKRILSGAKDRVRSGKLGAAGGQFIRASESFGGMISELVAVPRPAADDTRLLRWFGFLRIVKTNLRKVGKALREGNKVRAMHESIRVERSGNAANNVSFVFRFHYCRIGRIG